MKTHSRFFGVVIAGCLAGLALPPRAAAVTDEEFNALKDMVLKQGQRIDQLEKTHEQDQKTIEQNQKLREQDQQQIQQLKQQLGETQKTATDAQQKAEAASQVQPVHPIPGEGNATHNFTMVGDAEIQFGKVDGQHSGFVLADFAPIFLFRARDNVLFEAGFDVTLGNNLSSAGTHDASSSTSVSLSFAQLDYLVNNYVTFVGGDMLLPLGTYSERSAGWLNKIPDAPLARALVPGSGVGAQLRGAVPLGDSGESLSYSVYGVNGPSATEATGNAFALDANGNPTLQNLDLTGNVGIKNDTTFGNLHGSPSGGGRIAWFHPWKAHWDLELGLSGQYGTWDDRDTRSWSAGVFDGALHLGPSIEIKGEYIYTLQETADSGTINPRGWWIQGAYKLNGLNLELPLINNLELVGRYDHVNDFAANGILGRGDRYTFGYVYYLSNTLLFEGDYEFASSNADDLNHNLLVFQLSYGF